MVGDVTFQLLSRIGIRTIQTLSEMPAEVLQQMIGKNGIDIWKKANGIDNNPVEPYGKKVDLNGTHLWTRHYRHSKIKINISRHGRKTRFSIAF
jgi:DNA polymerase-4